MQSSPLPSSPPFMSGVCSSTFKSTLPRAITLMLNHCFHNVPFFQ
ncbi:hypothetical protein [Treponema endosymbiont of Eucomonympha sp.]